MILGDLIKQYRTETHMSMEQFAQKSGLSKAYVSILERDYNPVSGKHVVPSLETIKAVSSAIGLDFNDVIAMLDGNQPVSLQNNIDNDVPPGFDPLPEMDTVPLVGRIACGQPITAEENLEGYVSIPAEWHATFTLMCEGDSMEPRIKDGDLVAIHSQPMVENGEIAAVRIDCEATLKHVYLYPDKIVLQPENPNYEPIVKIGEEMNDVTIEGKAVGLCRGL